jgi:hypothetical protein
MPNSLPFNDDFILKDFFEILHKKGFTIDISDYIEASEITGQDDISLEEVKYSIGAIVCRNGVEQQHYYELFDAYIKHLSEELEERKTILKSMLKDIEAEKELKENFEVQEELERKKRKRIIVLSVSLLLILCCVLIGLFAKILKTEFISKIPEALAHSHTTVNQELTETVFNEVYHDNWAVKQSVYQRYFDPHYDTTDIQTSWRFQHDILHGKQIRFAFKNPGDHKVNVTVTTPDTTMTFDRSYHICDSLPEIIKSADGAIVNRPYKLSVTNNKKNENLLWIINNTDTIESSSNQIQYIFYKPGSHVVTCRFENQFCEHASKAQQIIEVADASSFTMSLTGVEETSKKYNTFFTTFYYIVVFILGILLIASFAGRYFVATIVNKYKGVLSISANNYLKNSNAPLFLSNKPPLEIRFYDKNAVIQEKDFIQRWSLALKKKIQSEENKLNLSKTIKETILNEDIFSPVYENKNVKRSYLFLIDASNAKSPIIHLYKYLVSQLTDLQVELEVYYYSKDPRRVYKRNIADAIDIHRLKNLHYGSVLIVCGKGYNFLYPDFADVKYMYKEIFSYWPQRVLITPLPAHDWSVKEIGLGAFFILIPADVKGLLNMFSLLEKGVNSSKTLKTGYYERHSIKGIDFEDIRKLRAYCVDSLDDKDGNSVLYWLAAMAIYPKISWHAILATGAASTADAVTYKNLLKICRIEWVDAGVFPTRIRLELLKLLPRENEINARKAIIRLLEEDSYRQEPSLAENERVMQLILNKFVLYLIDPLQFAMYHNEEKQFLELYRRKKIRDIALSVYLKGQDPDWPSENWHSPFGMTDKKVNNLESYYNTKTGTVPQEKVVSKFKYWLLAAMVLLSLALTSFAYVGITEADGIPLFVDKKEVVPIDWKIYLNMDDCYSAYNPEKIVITQGKRIIYESTVPKNNLIELDSFSYRKGKRLHFQLLSSDYNSISQDFIVNTPDSKLQIKGYDCGPPVRYVYGKKEDFRRYQAIIAKYARVITSPSEEKTANCILFSPQADSLDLYKLGLDLIRNKFPLKGLMLNKDLRKYYNEDIVIQSCGRDAPVLTAKDLTCQFYKKCEVSGITIMYYPSSLEPKMRKLSQFLKYKGYPEPHLMYPGDAKHNVTYFNKGTAKAAAGIADNIRSFLKYDIPKVDLLKEDVTIVYENPGDNPYIFPMEINISIKRPLKIASDGVRIPPALTAVINNMQSKRDYVFIASPSGSGVINHISYSTLTTAKEVEEFREILQLQDLKIERTDPVEGLKVDIQLDHQAKPRSDCSPKKTANGYIVYFKEGTAQFTAESELFLNKIIPELISAQRGGYKYYVDVNSFYVPDKTIENLPNLAQRFAPAVANYLTNRGVSVNISYDMGTTGAESYSDSNCFNRVEINIKNNVHRKILWLGNNSQDNAATIGYFKKNDIDVTVIRSVNEVLEYSKIGDFDFVIADMTGKDKRRNEEIVSLIRELQSNTTFDMDSFIVLLSYADIYENQLKNIRIQNKFYEHSKLQNYIMSAFDNSNNVKK